MGWFCLAVIAILVVAVISVFSEEPRDYHL